METHLKYDKPFKKQTVLKILSKETAISEMAHTLNLHYTAVRIRSFYTSATGAVHFRKTAI